MNRSDSDEKLLGLFPALEVPGGVQTSGKVAWEGIQNRGFKAYLFCYGTDEAGDNYRGDKNAIHVFSKFNAIAKALRKRWAVQRILVWHIGLLKLLPFLRAPDAKVLLFLHGIEIWRPQGWLTRALLRQVDLFISNSDYTWQRFIQANPECKDMPCQTVHLGISEPLNDKIPAPDVVPAALMLGRMVQSEDYKGHWEMINAWPLVLKHIPEAELWVAGDGDRRLELEDLVRKQGLESKVHFLGWVSEEKKQELLGRCRCLALPSRGEGFGLVYLEAMRMGRPCLASNQDAGREVVNPPEAGLAVNQDDPEALAAALYLLLSEGEEWDTWSREARQRYEHYFTAEHFQRRLIEALLTVGRKNQPSKSGA